MTVSYQSSSFSGPTPAGGSPLPSSHTPCDSSPSLCLRCNALQTNNPTYFKSCKYDPFFSPFCPVFRVRDMVEAAGETFGDLALLVLAFLKIWKMPPNLSRMWARGRGQDWPLKC